MSLLFFRKISQNFDQLEQLHEQYSKYFLNLLILLAKKRYRENDEQNLVL